MKLDRSNWRRLKITGSDRVRFLQGLTTINVEKLGDGEHAWGAILNPKGRVLSVIALARMGETIGVLTEASLGDKTRGLLTLLGKRQLCLSPGTDSLQPPKP